MTWRNTLDYVYPTTYSLMYTKTIYKHDYEKPQDPYDLEKVNKGSLKTQKGTGKSCFVDMKKQDKRALKKMYQANVGDAFANIKREKEMDD